METKIVITPLHTRKITAVNKYVEIVACFRDNVIERIEITRNWPDNDNPTETFCLSKNPNLETRIAVLKGEIAALEEIIFTTVSVKRKVR